MKTLKRKPRKYIRKCGFCGVCHEQSNMIRTHRSANGWVYLECYSNLIPEHEFEEW